MGDTSIAWTEKSWNPIAAFDRETGKRGWFCVHASPGCLHCYAEARNKWIGNGHAYRVPEADKVELRIVETQLREPFAWRKTHRVFVCSMTDLFYDGHSDDMVDQVFAVMALARRHTFQLLTKRAGRMCSYLRDRATYQRVRALLDDRSTVAALYWQSLSRAEREQRQNHQWWTDLPPKGWPLPNVWCGVSAEDQARWDQRWPLLRETPAVVRWVSYEPALTPVDFRDVGGQLHWVVVGGESGPGARPFDLQWARDVVTQCRANGVAPFVKQLGAKPFACASGVGHGQLIALDDAKGEDPAEWPADLRVREWPRVRE